MLPPAAPELSAWFHEFQRSCFRLETLQGYGGSGEDASITEFLAGATPQPHPGKREWMGLVRAAARDGRTMQRVHVVTEPLTDYVVDGPNWPGEYLPRSDRTEPRRGTPRCCTTQAETSRGALGR